MRALKSGQRAVAADLAVIGIEVVASGVVLLAAVKKAVVAVSPHLSLQHHTLEGKNGLKTNSLANGILKLESIIN